MTSKRIACLAFVLALAVAPLSAFFGAPSGLVLAASSTVKDAVPGGFSSATVAVNGTILHYVAGGSGPALVLLHGFPEDWSAYAKIVPQLAKRFRVVAVDLRGIGKSSHAERGYDVATMAEDVRALAAALKLDRPYVVGHDFGGMVTYAIARLHPEALRGAMILDVPLAGVDPWDQVKADPRLWHFGFHQAPGLAEKLLAGREAIYIGYFMRRSASDPQAISDDDIARYARAYAGPRMNAAMAMYRAFSEDEAFGKDKRGTLDVPIALVGSEKSFAPMLPAIAKGLKEAGAVSVTTDIVSGAGHYLIDEKPEEIGVLIERYAAAARAAHAR
jgi:pimeloyl-ACP methyl ester carboxylesterase